MMRCVIQLERSSAAIDHCIQLFGFLIGGHDTTSGTFKWALKTLSFAPQAQSTLRARLRAAYPAAVAEQRNPTAEEIIKGHIPYLDAMIEERRSCLSHAMHHI
jgi:cytochrome P450